MKTIGFIGGGRITKIILQAFKSNDILLDKVVVLDSNVLTLNALKEKFPYISTTTDDFKGIATSDIVFIALHPPMILETLSNIKNHIKTNTIIVSFAPKITMDKMSAALDGFANIARMNPSASSIVNKGVNPIAFMPGVSTETKNRLLEIVQPLGFTPEVGESKIEAYALISAMGHTYFFFQIQKLKELAISFGMDDKEAQKAISEMLWGTTETLFNSGLSYDEVADLVPVKPLGEVEETILGFYDQFLVNIFNRIKP